MAFQPRSSGGKNGSENGPGIRASRSPPKPKKLRRCLTPDQAASLSARKKDGGDQKGSGGTRFLSLWSLLLTTTLALETHLPNPGKTVVSGLFFTEQPCNLKTSGPLQLSWQSTRSVRSPKEAYFLTTGRSIKAIPAFDVG